MCAPEFAHPGLAQAPRGRGRRRPPPGPTALSAQSLRNCPPVRSSTAEPSARTSVCQLRPAPHRRGHATWHAGSSDTGGRRRPGAPRGRWRRSRGAGRRRATGRSGSTQSFCTLRPGRATCNRVPPPRKVSCRHISEAISPGLPAETRRRPMTAKPPEGTHRIAIGGRHLDNVQHSSLLPSAHWIVGDDLPPCPPIPCACHEQLPAEVLEAPHQAHLLLCFAKMQKKLQTKKSEKKRTDKKRRIQKYKRTNIK